MARTGMLFSGGFFTAKGHFVLAAFKAPRAKEFDTNPKTAGLTCSKELDNSVFPRCHSVKSCDLPTAGPFVEWERLWNRRSLP